MIILPQTTLWVELRSQDRSGRPGLRGRFGPSRPTELESWQIGPVRTSSSSSEGLAIDLIHVSRWIIRSHLTVPDRPDHLLCLEEPAIKWYVQDPSD